MFKTAEGQEETVQVGPTVTRFNELKVGDSVTFKDYESLVFQLKKPGAPPVPAVTRSASPPEPAKRRAGRWLSRLRPR